MFSYLVGYSCSNAVTVRGSAYNLGLWAEGVGTGLPAR
jgi:hypothetical protein